MKNKICFAKINLQLSLKGKEIENSCKKNIYRFDT